MILVFLKLILAYLLPVAVGYGFLQVLDRQSVLSKGYKIFAGALLGIGLFTLETFTALILGAKVSLALFAGVWALDLAVIFGVMIFLPEMRSRLHPQPLSQMGEGRKNEVRSFANKWISILIFLVLAAKIALSLWQVSNVPTYEFDGWNNWNLRPKVIFTEKALPLDPSGDFYLGGGIKSYPLNDSLWKVWIATLMGEWQEQAVNTASVFYFIILLGLFYFSLPHEWSRFWKLGTTYLLASLPFLYFHSRIPYVDLFFGAYLFLAVSAWYWFWARRQNIYFFAAAVGLALAIWTKNEGFAVVLPVLILVLLCAAIRKEIPWKKAFGYGLLVAAVSSPWLTFRFARHLDLLSGDSGSFKLLVNEQFVREWFLSVFIRSHFNFLWLFLLLLAAVKIKEIWLEPDLRFLCLAVGLLFVFYNGIILFTDKAFDLSALVRVNLQLVPLAFFLAAVILKREFLGKPQ